MADNESSETGSGGWPAFLSELTKNFLILRDVFGYALPGAIFLMIGVVWRSHFLDWIQSLVAALKFPPWLLIVLGLGVCYTIGHLTAAIAYLPFNTWGVPHREAFELWKWLRKKDAEPDEPLFPALISIRATHPELLTELERQSIMTHLRGSTAVAMLLGYAFFCLYSSVDWGWTMLAAGLFLLFTFWFSAYPHITELRKDTVAAAKAVDSQAKLGEPTIVKQMLRIIAAAQTADD